MNYNIYFNNFINENFKSKNSKNLIKKYIKSNIENNIIENDTIKNFDSIKKYIIYKYLNDTDLDLIYEIKSDNIYIIKINSKNNLLKKLKYINKINY